MPAEATLSLKDVQEAVRMGITEGIKAASEHQDKRDDAREKRKEARWEYGEWHQLHPINKLSDVTLKDSDLHYRKAIRHRDGKTETPIVEVSYSRDDRAWTCNHMNGAQFDDLVRRQILILRPADDTSDEAKAVRDSTKVTAGAPLGAQRPERMQQTTLAPGHGYAPTGGAGHQPGAR